MTNAETTALDRIRTAMSELTELGWKREGNYFYFDAATRVSIRNDGSIKLEAPQYEVSGVYFSIDDAVAAAIEGREAERSETPTGEQVFTARNQRYPEEHEVFDHSGRKIGTVRGPSSGYWGFRLADGSLAIQTGVEPATTRRDAEERLRMVVTQIRELSIEGVIAELESRRAASMMHAKAMNQRLESGDELENDEKIALIEHNSEFAIYNEVLNAFAKIGLRAE